MAGLPIWIFTASTPDGEQHLVSCLSPEQAFEHGLGPEAIIGGVRRPLEVGEGITPAVFVRNRAFVDFMHQVIGRRAPESRQFAEDIRRQGDGWAYLIDQRTKTPTGDVPPHDVVGAFEVRDGRAVPNSHQPNANHRILTDDGFVQLGEELQHWLLEELAARIRSRRADE